MTHKKKKAPELSGEAESWKQFEREERIAWWAELGRNAFVAFIASVVATVVAVWLTSGH
jgi:negative regulator of sigma E activity